MKITFLKTAGIIIAALTLLRPLQAEAGEALSVKNTLNMPAGAAALICADLTAEEYIEAANQAVGSYWGYTNLGIANVDNNLNVRETPDESGKLVGKLPKDCACEVIRIKGDWAYIESGDVKGYVRSEYLLTGLEATLRAKNLAKAVATVDTEALKIREEPNTDCGVLTLVPKGEKLEVVEELEDWVKINLDDESYYVSADYVVVEEQLGSAVTMTELMYGQGVSNVRVDLCQYAKQFLGNPYVWGGTSLTKGADCSGFVLSVFKKYGVTLSHSSRAQANEGTKINASQAQPGDLFFYGKNGVINHVAIYIGNGQVIHASSPTTGIKISNCNYRTPLKVVKVLE